MLNRRRWPQENSTHRPLRYRRWLTNVPVTAPAMYSNVHPENDVFRDVLIELYISTNFQVDTTIFSM